ncbi:MAG TPA: lamin tail domain-containing protein, partial [Anaerolineae bacterium]
MYRSRVLILALLALAMVAGSVLPYATPATQAASTNVVISQVYGGGGNAGGVYTNDFVELFNRGTVAASLGGWSVQYAGATGTGNFGASTTQITELPNVTLEPGQYFLIQEAAGTNAIAALPTPDFVDPTPINLSGTGGKVVLATTATTLGCNGSSTPCSTAQLALIKDLVGWD